MSAQQTPWLTNTPIIGVQKQLYVQHTQPQVGVGAVQYAAGPGLERIEFTVTESVSDIAATTRMRVSSDNGQTWSAYQDLPGSLVMYAGVEVWESWGSMPTYDPQAGLLIAPMSRQIRDSNNVNHNWTYYRLSRDYGVTWSAPHPLKYETGADFDPANPMNTEFLNHNESSYGQNFAVLTNGAIVMGVGGANDPFDPTNNQRSERLGYLNFVGRWNPARQDYDWTPGQRYYVSTTITSRGLAETSTAQLRDGRVMQVWRGSNTAQTPGRRWFTISSDGGLTLGTLQDLRYDDDTTFYAPGSQSNLTRHEGNGKLYWIGNITPTPPSGNRPRYPLVIAEVDEATVALIKDTVSVIDDRQPGQASTVQFSNFTFPENRVTHQFEIYLTDWCAQSNCYDADAYKYTLTLAGGVINSSNGLGSAASISGLTFRATAGSPGATNGLATGKLALDRLTLYRGDNQTPVMGTGYWQLSSTAAPVYVDVYSSIDTGSGGRNVPNGVYVGSSSSAVVWNNLATNAHAAMTWKFPGITLDRSASYWLIFSESPGSTNTANLRLEVNSAGDGGPNDSGYLPDTLQVRLPSTSSLQSSRFADWEPAFAVDVRAIGDRPAVVQSPQTTTNSTGDSVTLSALFTNGVLAVQWFKDGASLSGGTSFSNIGAGQLSTYSLSSASLLDRGSYYCRATNNLGATNTSTAFLEIVDSTPPTILSNTVSVWASRVRLYFSEPVDAATAGAASNYVFQAGLLSVSSVRIVDSLRVDVVTAPKPVPGSNYVLRVSNVKDLSGNAILTNTAVAIQAPNTFPAMGSLVMAFNAGSAVANPAGGYTWSDLSGNGNNAVNSSSALDVRPSLVTNALNGRAVFSFTASKAQWLSVATAHSVGLNQSNYTWFIVARCANLGSGTEYSLTPRVAYVLHVVPPAADVNSISDVACFFYDGEPNAANDSRVGYQRGLDFYGRTANPSDPGNQTHTFPHPLTNDQWYAIAGHVDVSNVWCWVLNPNSNITVGGTNIDYMYPQGVGAFLPAEICFGCTSSSKTTSYRFGGDIAEVLLYTGAMAESDITSVMNYLRKNHFPPSISASRNGSNISVQFTGVLQSSTNIAAGYADLAGNPTSPYTITQANQLQSKFFRTRSP